MDVTQTQDQNAWYASYPTPQTVAASVSREEVLQWLRDGDKRAGHDFVLVDLRRTDYEGGTIRGSVNLPAQSLYHAIPTWYAVLSQTEVRTVVWYCGSSRGRAPRAAGWFADYLATAAEGNATIQSLVLEGGIKGWASSGEEYTSWMDGYEATVWKR